MVKTHFDFGSFKSLMNELSSNSDKIDALEKENQKIQHCILEKIQKATLDWEPVLNKRLSWFAQQPGMRGMSGMLEMTMGILSRRFLLAFPGSTTFIG
jgi:hypothetical protein